MFTQNGTHFFHEDSFVGIDDHDPPTVQEFLRQLHFLPSLKTKGIETKVNRQDTKNSETLRVKGKRCTT